MRPRKKTKHFKSIAICLLFLGAGLLIWRSYLDACAYNANAPTKSEIQRVLLDKHASIEKLVVSLEAIDGWSTIVLFGPYCDEHSFVNEDPSLSHAAKLLALESNISESWHIATFDGNERTIVMMPLGWRFSERPKKSLYVLVKKNDGTR